MTSSTTAARGHDAVDSTASVGRWPVHVRHQHGAAALGNPGEQVEQLQHYRAPADDILEAVPRVELLLQLFYLGQVLKGLDPADHVILIILEKRSRYAYRHPITGVVNDIGSGIDNGPAVRHGPFQRTRRLANIRMEDLEAALPDRLVTGDPGNVFCGRIK